MNLAPRGFILNKEWNVFVIKQPKQQTVNSFIDQTVNTLFKQR